MGAYAHCMMGKLIAFVIYSKGDRTKSSKFSKKFYGQDTSSHSGKYRYRKKGFLDNVPHIKLIRGVIIVKKEDIDRVLSFLSHYDLKILIRNVELKKEDIQILNKN
jgi:hypothetical protein